MSTLAFAILIAYILLVHFIADFLLQTRWQAENKSSSNRALGLHVASYTIFLGLFTFAGAGDLLPLGVVLAWTLVNGAIHFGVDWCTSRLTTRYYKADRMDHFWAMIGFDQFLHGATLVLTLAWVLSAFGH